MRLAISGMFSALLLVSASLAQDSPEACALLKDDSARLECYDLVFHKTAEKPEPRTKKSKWHARIDKSRIDDSTSVFLSTGNIEPVSDEYGRPQQLRLWVRCTENTTAAYIDFDGMFMSDLNDAGTITFRVNEEKAFSRNLDVSTNNRALGFWSGGVSIPFIKKIMHGDDLIIRARPHSGSWFTTRFKIAGLDEEIEPLREACHW